MQIALAGRPGCGRTTLLRALAGNPEADPEKPLTAELPDRRLDTLGGIHPEKRRVYDRAVFRDVPSPSLSPANLPLVRNSQLLAAVVDNYARGALTEDFLDIEAELIVADMALCEKRLSRLRKEGGGSGREAALMNGLLDHMGTGMPLRVLEIDPGDLQLLSPYSLLSLMPLVVVSNRMGDPVTEEGELEREVALHGGRHLAVDSGFELELAGIDEDEREPFLRSIGFETGCLSRFADAVRSTLDLLTFYTIGDDEVRAWPLRRGSTALAAAAAIHTDMARGFIRAVVVPFDTYRENPDMTELREQGLLRTEGRDYSVSDGDIVRVRFCV